MKFPYRTSVLLFVSTFLLAEVVQAGLLRTSGRGSLSREFSEVWYYVDNGSINEFGDATFNYSFGAGPGNTKGVGGGAPGVNAVPSDPCIASYTRADVDDEIDFVNSEIDFLNSSFGDDEAENDRIQAQIDDLFDELNQLESSFPFGNDPCVWEFEEGEDLFTFGTFQPFGNEDIAYDVEWSIVGDGVSERLEGGIQRGPNPLDPSVGEGWVTLNAPAPASLVPGDYSLFVSVSLVAPDGKFFYTSSEPGDEVEVFPSCRFPEDDDATGDVCGFNSFDTFTDELVTARTSFFSDVGEILRIIPSSTPPDDDPVAVPAPSTFAAVLAGLLILVRGRRARVAPRPR